MKYYKIVHMLNEDLLADLESSDYDILSHKVFQGESRIKVELIRFNNDFNPIIKITGLEDPNMTGYSEYNSKIEAIQAFNNLGSMEKLVKYMGNYQNEPYSLKWAILLQDEGETVKKSAGVGDESGMVSASSPGGMYPPVSETEGMPGEIGETPFDELPPPPEELPSPEEGEPIPGAETGPGETVSNIPPPPPI